MNSKLYNKKMKTLHSFFKSSNNPVCKMQCMRRHMDVVLCDVRLTLKPSNVTATSLGPFMPSY